MLADSTVTLSGSGNSSNSSQPSAAAIAAVVKGATIVEKHIPRILKKFPLRSILMSILCPLINCSIQHQINILFKR